MKPHWSVKPFLWLFAVVTVPLAFKEKKKLHSVIYMMKGKAILLKKRIFTLTSQILDRFVLKNSK